jgi:hypothetical protein
MEHDETRGRPPSRRPFRRMRLGVWLGAAAAAVSVAAGIQAATDQHTRIASGKMAVHRADVAPPGMYISGDQLNATPGSNTPIQGKPSQTLVAKAISPLVGAADPVGATSPDGSVLAYNTWTWARSIDWNQPLDKQGIADGAALGTPAIHILNLATGADTALEPGSFSLAWRADGALAYAAGSATYRWSQEYDRHVAVRTPGTTGAQTWSSPGLYRVEGWAGAALLVERDIPGDASELDVFDGPQQSRVLAVGADLLAISPAGDTALVAESPADNPSPSVRLIRVSDGAELASLPLAQIVDPVTSTPVSWLAGPADWRGSKVVAASETGLVVLSVDGTTLNVDQVMHLDAATQPNGMLYEPRFAGSSTSSIVAWSDVSTPTDDAWASAQLVCDRVQLTCGQSLPVTATLQPRPVYDRSGGQS